MGISYLDGAWVDDDAATVSVRSRALNYGLGCLGGIRGYLADDGSQVNIFRLADHVRRLAHSARILHLRLPDDAGDVLMEVLRRNEVHHDVYLRPLLLHDSDGLAPILDETSSRFVVWIMPLRRYLSDEAIDVKVSSWRRVSDNAIPTRAKPTGAYLNSALARREALDDGYDEAILLTEAGMVSEGSAEHVFLVRDGVLVSPPSTEDNLDGITRRTVIALAREDLGIAFEERPVARSELYVADEVFLCGTGAEVTPVRSVDRRPVGEGKPGPVTTAVAGRFEDVVRGRVPERMEWLTPVW